ncbi:DUF559 domain-containing protein [Robertkochia marina]|uniref:DUF559 domain-containing protein n=2 Tax=Robertkochia marina TaxID=1227945 RepID=A0A4S3M255_9FLAO|nr:DUF559 domain-containing protein [Robertkochia marina]TRZ40939.1 DUF559 domain-containing protein [Robertkochia marina]
MWKGANQQTFLKARELRRHTTESESVMKTLLNSNQFKAYKFRYQHPLGIYIVDFYSHRLQLVIEVDGEYHNTKKQIEFDNKRTEFLEYHNLKVIRFSNRMVLNNIKQVELALRSLIENNFPSAL